LTAYLVYRHGRVSAGHHRRAVKIRRGSVDAEWFTPVSQGERMGAFSFYNDSDINQPFTIDSTRVLWPLMLLSVGTQGEFYFPPTGVPARDTTGSVVMTVRRKNGKPCVAKSCIVLVRTRDSVRDKRIRHIKKIHLLPDDSPRW
jgi:hypothetical protein